MKLNSTCAAVLLNVLLMCVAVVTANLVDDLYNSLVTDEDHKRAGMTLPRYLELYEQFLGNASDIGPAVFLYGPIPE
uniref:Putative secreted protein n=1 Tax=Psorophora albipes TaxID=869069 RepID=T1E3H1_9DIPT